MLKRGQIFSLFGIISIFLMPSSVLVTAQPPTTPLPPLMYLSFHNGYEDQSGPDIDIVNPQTKHFYRLLYVPSQYDIRSPQWSPDGTHIAFTADQAAGEEDSLFIMDADGRHKHLLVPRVGDYMWSPDSQQIVFTIPTSAEKTLEIHTVNIDGTGDKTLIQDGDLPAWSPDGTKIAYRGVDGVYVMNADRQDSHQLTPQINYLEWLQWSPDGTKLAFVDSGDAGGTLYTVNADGTHVQSVATGIYETAYVTFEWSPDSTQIAFLTSEPAMSLFVINADGSHQRLVVKGVVDDGTAAPADFVSFYSLSWSPDGTKIAFSGRKNYQFNIYIVNADGSDIRQITMSTELNDLFPTWRPIVYSKKS